MVLFLGIRVQFAVCFGRGKRESKKKGHQHNSFYSANKLRVRRLKWDETLSVCTHRGRRDIFHQLHMEGLPSSFRGLLFFYYYRFLVGHMLVSAVVHFLLPEFCACHFEKWKEVYLFVKKKEIKTCLWYIIPMCSWKCPYIQNVRVKSAGWKLCEDRTNYFLFTCMPLVMNSLESITASK